MKTEDVSLLCTSSKGRADVAASASPLPGTDCPTCNRRVPRPKTEASPPTRRMAYWTPADSSDDHKALIAAAARHLGCYEQPFYEAKVMEIGVVLILQDPKLENFAQRAGA